MSSIQPLNPGHYTFTRTSVSVITLTPDGIDGSCTIWVSDGAESIPIRLTAALTCDFGVLGAGGRDTGAEGNFGYDVHLFWDGTTAALMYTKQGLSPSDAEFAYTHKSKRTFFVDNTVGDIADFTHAIDGTCYRAVGVALITNGKQITTPVAIDYTGYVPNNCRAIVHSILYDTANAGAICSIYAPSSTIGQFNDSAGTSDGRRNTAYTSLPVINPATSRYYVWSVTPSNGLTEQLRGWKL
jgi:hypothetical protein